MLVWFSIPLFSACTRWERAENTYKAILEKDPVDSVSASFSSILGYFDWLDLCDAKFVLGWCDCRKQNSTITIVVINAFCYLKKNIAYVCRCVHQKDYSYQRFNFHQDFKNIVLVYSSDRILFSD